MRPVPDETIELLSRLVEIDSVNPSLVAGGAGESEIAAFVQAWASDAELRADVLEFTPGRPSVVVRAPGHGGGRTLLLCGHLDTVNVEGMSDPHVPRLEADRLYGRGAYDMKAGLAAALLACREAAGLELAGDVVVAAVADEEHASLGVQEVLATVSAEVAVVTEPTEMALVIAHRGFVWSEVEVHGRAAHGSRPHLGLDAIVKMGPVLTALGALDATLHASSHPLLGRPSVHASVIEGGEELSSYPARCVVGIERRTLPGESAADVEAELASILTACRAEDGELVASQRTLLVREPFEIAPDAAVVALVADAIGAVIGSPPPIQGASYWADAAFIAAAGIPTVMFGPGGAGAHETEEWVSVSDTATVRRVLVELARRVCG
jgi:acetylornithine deacetylase/succinyl-diaminopimelate desuccinylase family protein